jgi:hypothetical protein
MRFDTTTSRRFFFHLLASLAQMERKINRRKKPRAPKNHPVVYCFQQLTQSESCSEQ